METNKKNQNQGIDLAKTSGSSPPVAEQYLNYLHPSDTGMILPRGAQYKAEYERNRHGEPEMISSDEAKAGKWPGVNGSRFANADTVDGSKKWIISNLGKDLMLKDSEDLASIEQISLNAFTQIDKGSWKVREHNRTQKYLS